MDGFRQESDGWHIYDADGLDTFRNNVNNGTTYSGINIYLENDIDLNGENWTSIGSYSKQFKGKFDGKNHVVSNFNITGNTGNGIFYGFFGYVNTANISNLSVDNVSIDIENITLSADAYISLFCGDCVESGITNCHSTGSIKSDIITSFKLNFGGLIGYLTNQNKGDITKCSSDITYDIKMNNKGNYTTIGGLIGNVYYGKTKNAYNYAIMNGNITVETKYACYISGLLGYDSTNTYMYNSYAVSDLTINYTNTSTNTLSLNGLCHDSSHVFNCYAKYNFIVSSTAGQITFSPYSSGVSSSNKINKFVISNSRYKLNDANPSSPSENYCTRIDDENFVNGQICYNLNTELGSATPYEPTSSQLTQPAFYQPIGSYPYHTLNPREQVIINNYDDLIAFRDIVNNGITYYGINIYLENDIDLDSKNWTSIGNKLKPFKGNFDGKNHVVSNFNISNNVDYYGFFGYVDTANISNLSVNNVLIDIEHNTSTYAYISLFCGDCVESGITNCHSIGSIKLNIESSSILYIGGLIGYLNNRNKGDITKCSSNITYDIDVTSTGNYFVTSIGGLIGFVYYGKTKNAYNYAIMNGNITAETAHDCYISGLLGYTNGDTYMYNSYAVSNLIINYTNTYTYDLHLNGLCYDSSHVLNCYAKYNFTVSSTTPNKIRFLPYSSGVTYSNIINKFVIKESKYKLNDTSSSPSENYCTLINNSEFTNGQICYNLNTELGSATPYEPTSSQLTQPAFYQLIDPNPYPTLNPRKQLIINNYDDLIAFRDIVNNGINYSGINIYLENDIDLNGEYWTPIGNSLKPFKGIFDGKNHVIKNFNIVGNNGHYGFFGYIDSADISNVSVNNVLIDIEPNTELMLFACISLFCGYCIESSITNCHSIGSIKLNIELSSALCIGGLIGELNNINKGDITKCSSNITYDINVTNHLNWMTSIGGLVGYVSYGTTKNAYNYAIMNGNITITVIHNCYISGLLGYTTSDTYMYNSYAVSNLTINYTNTSTYKLFLNGLCYDSSHVLNCYAKYNFIMLSTTSDKIIFRPYSYYYYSDNKGKKFVISESTYTLNDTEPSSPSSDYCTLIDNSEFTNGHICHDLNTELSDDINTYYAPTTEQLTTPAFYQLIDPNLYPILHPPEQILINNYDDLIIFRDIVNNGINYSGINICLENDINLYSDDWTPIGNYSAPFKGNFDGKNHVIKNFNISNNNCYGFFGCVSTANISNLSVNNVSINIDLTLSADADLSLFCGYCNESGITNCHSSGLIKCNIETSNRLYIGGLIGYLTNQNKGNITKCSSNITYDIDVTSNSINDTFIGGLIGYVYFGKTKNAYNYAIMNGNITIEMSNTAYICGLAGYTDNDTYMYNSYAVSNLTINYTNTSTNRLFLNGLCRVSSHVLNCYAKYNFIMLSTTGQINFSPYSYVSYFDNKNQQFVISESTYTLNDTEPSSPSSDYCTLIENKNFINGYVCYNLNTELSDDINTYYAPTTTQLTTPAFYQSIGSYPYPILHPPEQILINNYDDLIIFRDIVNNGFDYSGINIYLENDIDLNGDDWTPIGNSLKPFKGNFDGKNHVVSNFNIIIDNGAFYGFFGYVNTANISNLSVENVLINTESNKKLTLSTNTDISLFCGDCYDSSITNCHSSGLIKCNIETSNKLYIGGLIGYLRNENSGDITKCSSNITYDISVTSNANNGSKYTTSGGLVGYVSYDKTKNAYNYAIMNGNITVETKKSYCYISGLLGYTDSDTYMHNSYAVSNLTINYTNTSTDTSTKLYLNGLCQVSSSVLNCYAKYNFIVSSTTTNKINFSPYSSGVSSSNKINKFVISESKYKLNDANSSPPSEDYCTRIENEKFINGQICYDLNTELDSKSPYGPTTDQLTTPIFYQTIGEDEYPVFDNTHQRIDISTISNIFDFYDTINDNNKILLFDNNIDFITSYNYQNQVYNNVILNEHKIFNVKLHDKLFYRLDDETDKENITYDKSNTISYLQSYDVN